MLNIKSMAAGFLLFGMASAASAGYAPCKQPEMVGSWYAIGMSAYGNGLGVCTYIVNANGSFGKGSNCVDEYGEKVPVTGSMKVNNKCVATVRVNSNGYVEEMFMALNRNRDVGVGGGSGADGNVGMFQAVKQ